MPEQVEKLDLRQKRKKGLGKEKEEQNIRVRGLEQPNNKNETLINHLVHIQIYYKIYTMYCKSFKINLIKTFTVSSSEP
jgi:hypothetical protein